ncbi:GNAT family N-acetyltransferase [Chromatiaceae bacterium AAb-1]|nr:GNAT family N-acetyltransferase [Chromatiaceae bacterium AAb-1]
MLSLQTSRLKIRYLTLDDAAFMLTLLNDPDYIRNIADRGVRTLADAQQYLTAGPLLSYQRHGYGLFIVELAASAELVGLCGLIFRDFLGIPDIGYAFLPQYRGQGLALEAAFAVKAYGQQQLKLPQIVAIVDQANQASVRVLNQLGLTFEKTITMPDTHKEVALFSAS